MVSEAQERLLAALPTDLQLTAVDLSDHAGVAEYCFPLEVGPKVLRCLIESGLVPLGGDIWRAEDSGYLFGDDGWYVNRDSADNGIELVKLRASECFARYKGAPGIFVTFVA